MKKLNQLLFVVAFTTAFSAFAAPRAARAQKRAVMFVLDISSSMSGANIVQVRNTLTQVVQSMPPQSAYGLVSFSGCAASDIKLELPLQAGNGKELVARANELIPTGSTDIFGGLSMAEQDIRRLGPDWCVKVLLLSDGDDTCGRGDAVALAKKITGAGACNSITSISIGVPAWESQVFENIARAGNGVHVPVEELSGIESVVDRELSSFLRERNQNGTSGWSGDYSGSRPSNGTPRNGDEPPMPEDPAPQPEPDQAEARRPRSNNNNNGGRK